MADSDYVPPDQRQLNAATTSFFVAPPHGWRHPVTGRRGWQPEPLLLAFGQYVKRSRYLAQMTQRQLSDASGVDQGQISRLERALAPAMSVERVVKLSGVLGRAIPARLLPARTLVPLAAGADERSRVSLAEMTVAEKARWLQAFLGVADGEREP